VYVDLALWRLERSLTEWLTRGVGWECTRPRWAFGGDPFAMPAPPSPGDWMHDGDKLFRDVWEERQRVASPPGRGMSQDELVTQICRAADRGALIRTASLSSTRDFIEESGLEMGDSRFDPPHGDKLEDYFTRTGPQTPPYAPGAQVTWENEAEFVEFMQTKMPTWGKTGDHHFKEIWKAMRGAPGGGPAKTSADAVDCVLREAPAPDPAESANNYKTMPPVVPARGSPGEDIEILDLHGLNYRQRVEALFPTGEKKTDGTPVYPVQTVEDFVHLCRPKFTKEKLKLDPVTPDAPKRPGLQFDDAPLGLLNNVLMVTLVAAVVHLDGTTHWTQVDDAISTVWYFSLPSVVPLVYNCKCFHTARTGAPEPKPAEAWRYVLFVLGVAGGAVTSYCALQDSTVRAYPSTTAVVGEVLREQTTNSVTLAIWASFFVAYGHLVVISCRLTSTESAAVNRTQRWGFHFLALIIAAALSVPWQLAFKRLPPTRRAPSSDLALLPLMLQLLQLPGSRRLAGPNWLRDCSEGARWLGPNWAWLGAVNLALSCGLWLRAAWVQDGSPFATWLTCFMFFNALTWCETAFLTPC
jgi:hypothetical protein